MIDHLAASCTKVKVFPQTAAQSGSLPLQDQGIDLHAGKIYFRSQKIYLTGKNGRTKSHMGNYFPFSGIKSVVLKKWR
jgi:hypothetical protein